MAILHKITAMSVSRVNLASGSMKLANFRSSNKLFTSATNSAKDHQDKVQHDSSDSQDNGDHKPAGWFDKMFVRRINPGKEPHSRLLSASEYIYEMHFHDAKPDTSETYIGKYEKYCKELTTKTANKAEHLGSWRVEIGDQDQFIHLWRYHDGYKQASTILNTIRSDQTLVKLVADHRKDLRKRESQFMMSFSFWDHPMPQDNNSFFEMRSYVLKPGTMIDWANGWSRGIKHRDNTVAGFFSQIGQLYTVHHLWRYDDLQVRKDVRENAWRKPGWDECVSITVPNIVSLHSRWMSPTSFSPIR